MRLIPNWKLIVKKAWSFRFMLLAGLFTTAEAVLPFFSDSIPRGLFAILTFVSVTIGMIMRVVAQKEFENE